MQFYVFFHVLMIFHYFLVFPRFYIFYEIRNDSPMFMHFNIYFYLALIAFIFTYCFLYILMRSTKHGHHVHHLHNIAFLHSIHHSFVAVILLISGFLIYSHTIDILQLFALAMIITGTYILVTNTKKT